MTNYKCKKGHIFSHLSKLTTRLPTDSLGERDFLETYVCPFCQTKEFEEVKEADPAVQNVYIYELGTGPQTALDALLADGYVIVNRYSKQYHLEKPKPQETQQ